jgi:hypothetical protein
MDLISTANVLKWNTYLCRWMYPLGCVMSEELDVFQTAISSSKIGKEGIMGQV